jgi:hypothetical protein
MDIRTHSLTGPQWDQEIDRLVSFLQDKDKHELTVSYGFGCDLEMDDLHQETPLPLSELCAWLAQSAEAGIFAFGESDLHIRSSDREVELYLGHECDIHLMTDNKELAQEVTAEWARCGFAPYQVRSKQQLAGRTGKE